MKELKLTIREERAVQKFLRHFEERRDEIQKRGGAKGVEIRFPLFYGNAELVFPWTWRKDEED